MALTRFDPPGFVDDLDDSGKQKWSDWVSSQLDAARDATEPLLTNFGPRPQFFNPLTTEPGTDAQEKDISWSAFPRVIQLDSPTDRHRWETLDAKREAQDEYCEWSITRDPQSGNITRVTFTSEGPEYWELLAQVNPQKVLELYREHISPSVQMSDLFSQGEYIRENKWNNSTSNGAMHLIQQNNTLGAEIELAAAATLPRIRNGRILTGAQELIECGRYGQSRRHSDPTIGAQVNELARAKSSVTLANPIGLCIAGLSTAGWTTPDGSDPSDYWKMTRGTKEKALRAIFEVPSSKGFAVSDIKINGVAISFGAQIADFITIKLTGLATRFGQSAAQPVGCVRRAVAPGTELGTAEEGPIKLRRPSRM